MNSYLLYKHLNTEDIFHNLITKSLFSFKRSLPFQKTTSHSRLFYNQYVGEPKSLLDFDQIQFLAGTLLKEMTFKNIINSQFYKLINLVIKCANFDGFIFFTKMLCK